jgi:hypothetical protein
MHAFRWTAFHNSKQKAIIDWDALYWLVLFWLALDLTNSARPDQI